MTRIAELEADFYPILEAALVERELVAYHTHDSRASESGFPDYTIPVGRWLLFAELKRTGRPLTTAQAGWLLRLRGPWRMCLAVDVAELGSLLRAIDNTKAGRLDRDGPAGFASVFVLGHVTGLGPLGSAAVGERVRPAGPSVAGSPAKPARQRRPCTRRSRRGS